MIFRHGHKGSTPPHDCKLLPPCDTNYKRLVRKNNKCIMNKNAQCAQMTLYMILLSYNKIFYLIFWLDTSSLRIKKFEPRSQVSHTLVSWRVTACTKINSKVTKEEQKSRGGLSWFVMNAYLHTRQNNILCCKIRNQHKSFARPLD